MKCQRVRKYVAIGAGILLIPPLAWVALVLLAPTGWVKRHVVATLEARSHRPVRIEGVSACLLGGIQLSNLEIGSPHGTADPWLKCGDLRLDISLLQLLSGRLEPSLLDVDGVRLRVLRRADGSLELADLTAPVDDPGHFSDMDGDSSRVRHRLAVQIHNASIELVDESTGTQLLFTNVDGDGFCDGRQSSIDRLWGTVNGGPFRFVAHLDRTAPVTRFQARFVADQVDLDDGMGEVLRYVVPVLAGSSFSLKGKMHTDFQLHGSGTSRAALRRSLVGQGEIAINPIELDGAPVMNELSRIAELSGRGRVASIHSNFVIKDRRITTDHFTLNVGRIPITMSGWTDLDGQIDYRIKLDGLTQRIPDKARRILHELNVDVAGLNMLTLNGTVDQVALKFDGNTLDRNPIKDHGLYRDDRERLKVLGRQFLDRIVR